MSQQKVDRYKQEKAHRKERLEKEKKRKKAPSHLQLFRTCSNRTCDCFCNLPPLYSQDRDAGRNRNHCRKRNRNNYS